MPNVVMVTGVSRFVGAHLAARLAGNADVERVVGVDTVPPHRDLLRRMGRTEFIRADIRNPLIAKVISGSKVDTVIHASMNSDGAAGSRAAMKEMNVIGTMQLLAACQKSPLIRKLIVQSTSAVYGASSRDPAMFTEDMGPKDLPSSGYAKDAVEIEGYVRGFGRRRPDVDITTLRFTNLIGPRIETALTHYFGLPIVPVALGYDARLQMLHPEDALAVFERAVLGDLPGVFNVGGDGVLMLSQAIRRAGRLPMPVPSSMVSPVSAFLRGARTMALSSEQMRFLNFGHVVDTSKLLREFGFVPRWTTQQSFDDFVRGHDLRPVISPGHVTAVERHIGDAVTRMR